VKKVVVLMGGISSEKEVSMETGRTIYEALLTQKDLSVEKYVLNEDILGFINYLNANKDVVIFNALHGKFGEDGRIQSILDLMKIPYTHSGVLTSSLAMNKILSKEIAKCIEIPVVAHQSINPKEFKVEDLKIAYPFVIKPIDEGSSVGIFLIQTQEDLEKALAKLQDFNLVMIEEYIKGVECTVGVIEGKALCVTEIIPINNFYDYESKYASGGSKHILPANLPEAVQSRMKEYSEKIYKTFGARGALRVDFIYLPEEDTAFILEVNNQPGMTPTSLLPEQAKYLGISFINLCVKLINLAKFDS
jgi:D-alanine-D-alanine ligase